MMPALGSWKPWAGHWLITDSLWQGWGSQRLTRRDSSQEGPAPRLPCRWCCVAGSMTSCARQVLFRKWSLPKLGKQRFLTILLSPRRGNQPSIPGRYYGDVVITIKRISTPDPEEIIFFGRRSSRWSECPTSRFSQLQTKAKITSFMIF